jgi:hypothetical protein
MTRPGPYNDNASFDEEESSGVTSLVPVPVKPVRLSGLDENDRTQYFSVGALLERGKAVAAREQERGLHEPATPPAEPLPGVPLEPGLLQQIRQASFARKASALLLPMLILLLVVKPVFKKPKHAAAPAAATSAASLPSASASAPAPAVEPKLAATPAQPPPAVPRGVSLEKAAVDAVAAGDFTRALALYRELSRREPQRAAYKDAALVLERRVRAQTP